MMDLEPYVEIFRRHSRPLVPRPTGVSPRLVSLPDVRAVLFDVYGTLMISASGDVGTQRSAARGDAFSAALEAVGIQAACDGDRGMARFFEAIERSHARQRARGVEFPEVDIVRIWRSTLRRLLGDGAIGTADVADVDLRRLAIEYETRVNPVWPMPGMRRCLADLVSRGITWGIISNAQFFTPLVIRATAGASLDELGADRQLRFYSYRHGTAKPGLRLFGLAADALALRGFRPQEVLYAGNDMVNDIMPAGKLGFRTALFAGDARSLRLREGHPLVGDTVPDAVVTQLLDLSCKVATARVR